MRESARPLTANGLNSTHVTIVVIVLLGLVLSGVSLAAVPTAQVGQSTEYRLEGERNPPPGDGDWTTGELAGWLNGSCVPFMLTINQPVVETIVMEYDYERSGGIGYDHLEGIFASGATISVGGAYFHGTSAGTDLWHVDVVLQSLSADPVVLTWCA